MKKLILFTILYSSSFLLAEGISGVTYFGYSMYNTNTDREDDKDRGFELKRVYLTYKKKISDKTSFKFQADMQNKNQEEETAYYMYIKTAKLDLKIFKETTLTIGMQGMNMFNIAEKTWGNRFLSKSTMDIYQWSASSDLGIGLSQTFGDVFTSLLLTNGEGYKSTSQDSNEIFSFQAVYGEKRLDNNNGFNLGGVFSMINYETEAGIADDNGKYTTKPKYKSARVMGVFVGFSGFGARVGFDYNIGTDLALEAIEDNDDTDAIDQTVFYGKSSTLMSFYTNYNLAFIKGLSIMVRYDSLDPGVEDNQLTDGDGMDESVEDNITSIIAGLIYKCTDGVTVSPNIVQTTLGSINPVMNINLSFQFQF